MLRNALFVLTFVVLGSSLLAQDQQTPADTMQANTLFADLVSKGVAVTPQVTVQLPAPALADGLSADEQNKQMEKVSKKDAQTFIINSSVNPTWSINAIRDSAGKQIGSEVHFYFVALGDLKTISDAGLLTKLVEISDANRSLPREAKALSPEEHQARNLEETSRPGYEDWYYGLNIPVMNLIQLSGIGFAVRTRTDESILAAINYLPKFQDDPEYSSVWRKIVSKAGVPTVDDVKNPYEGLGGYLKATQLQGSNDRVFVECHLVFAQPEEWFGGKDPLTSKLGIGIRDNVRKFSRDLKRASGK
jgi:hypothetical protein